MGFQNPVAVDDHGAELPAAEPLAAMSDAFMPVEDRPGAAKPRATPAISGRKNGDAASTSAMSSPRFDSPPIAAGRPRQRGRSVLPSRRSRTGVTPCPPCG
ncbi:MAG: hypothetical protein MUE98_09885 [Rhodobacteraceae bacterium]|nr:hypothetical protein [Paracoccaceae bacterium]